MATTRTTQPKFLVRMLRYRTNVRTPFAETPGAQPGGRADEGYVLASAARRR